MRQNKDMCVYIFRLTMLRVTSPERQEERLRWTQTGCLWERQKMRREERRWRAKHSDRQDESKRKLKTLYQKRRCLARHVDLELFWLDLLLKTLNV